MKPYHFIIPKGFSLYKNSSIIYQTHVTYLIYWLPFILPNLRLEFPHRRDEPPMPLLYCYCGIIRRHRKFWILVDEFDFLEIPLLSLRILFFPDSLDNHPKQVVLVAIQRPDFTDYHIITYRGGLQSMRSESCFVSTNYNCREDTLTRPRDINRDILNGSIF